MHACIDYDHTCTCLELISMSIYTAVNYCYKQLQMYFEIAFLLQHPPPCPPPPSPPRMYLTVVYEHNNNHNNNNINGVKCSYCTVLSVL